MKELKPRKLKKCDGTVDRPPYRMKRGEARKRDEWIIVVDEPPYNTSVVS